MFSTSDKVFHTDDNLTEEDFLRLAKVVDPTGPLMPNFLVRLLSAEMRQKSVENLNEKLIDKPFV